MRLGQKIVVNYIRAKFNLLAALSKKKAAAKAFALFCTPQYRNKKTLPPIFEKAEIINFDFQGYTIQGYRWNAGREQKTLILHGFESSVINFDRYVKPLIKYGFEVLAFDAPAHGRSTGKQINAVLYKDFVLHLRKNYGPVSSFITHSFGGLALSLALEEMPAKETDRVVFIAPATETSTAINSFFSFLQLNDELKVYFNQFIKEISGHEASWFSIRRIAPKLKCHVLWLQDKDDEMTPLRDVQPIIDEQYPNFEFYITEGLGHRRIYRDNKASRKIIEFITGQKNIAPSTASEQD
jgi:pimeloyl-ACP methyl ester carboxylesterase